MSSHVLINNYKKYFFEFYDSIYRFNEDYEDTINHYCSLREVAYDDIENLLFIIHRNISKLKYEDAISEDLLKLYRLDGYGEGPQYENEENYYVLSGNFLVKEICDEFILLKSEDKSSLVKICDKDFEMLIDCDIENLEKGDTLSFEGMTLGIFVNEKQKNNIIKLLTQDISNLNKLLSELKMNNRMISITKPKLH